MPKREFLTWIFLGIVIRLIAAHTSLRFAHPDEWFQTVEFAQLMKYGVMTDVFEVHAHLRNLTVPALFTVLISWADAVSGADPGFRVFFIKFVVGMLDLAAVTAFVATMLRMSKIASKRWTRIALTCFLLPWFTVAESVRTSIEHLSGIAAITATIVLVRFPKRTFSRILLGMLLVFVGAIRYPSFLFSIGFCVPLLIERFRPLPSDHAADSHIRPTMLPIVLGIFFGAILFGLADASYFGRSWESLWMYLQFNLLTGLSAHFFGAQGVAAYLTFFWEHFGGGLLLLGLPFLGMCLHGLFLGAKSGQPWAWGTVVFIVGHLLPTHKEPRFLLPILPFLLWSGFHYCWMRRQHISALLSSKSHKIFFAIITAVTLVANLFAALESLRGETWKVRGDFFAAQKLVQSMQPCALLSASQVMSSFLLRGAKSDQNFPVFPVAHIEMRETDTGALFPNSISVEWIDRAVTTCQAHESVFVHLKSVDDEWLQNGCSQVPLSTSSISVAMSTMFNGSVLLRCPNSILGVLSDKFVVKPLARNLPHLSKLPPLGVSGQEFLDMTGGREFLPEVPHSENGLL